MCYLVSILVPVYGVEKYIERCARSLFEQSYTNLEYVFVNDCTPDKSIDILRHVMEDYPQRKTSVRIIDHEKNRGVAAARNTALKNATGEFVWHVDSDDWIELDAVEKLVNNQLESGSDIVSGNMYIHTIWGIEEYHEPRYESKEQRVLMQIPNNCDHELIRRIVRRSLFEENNIRCLEGCNMAEDRFAMVQLCWFADGMSTIEGFVYHYDMNRPASYTKPTCWEQRLRGYMQELRNWIGIREFLSDKGEIYFNGTTTYMVDCIENAMKLALKYRDKECFQELVSVVNENKDCMEKMGWKINALGNLQHSFSAMWVRNSVNRVIGYARNLFNSK